MLIIKPRDASIILFPTLVDKSSDPSNELIRIIFYTLRICNILIADRQRHNLFWLFKYRICPIRIEIIYGGLDIY
jgi:hypothetical protein